jgi:hypothetical protein
MVKKSPKTTAKKSSRKVRDLPARKDPRGGSQKKETAGNTSSTRRGATGASNGKLRLN